MFDSYKQQIRTNKKDGYPYLAAEMIKAKAIHNILRKLLHANNKYLQKTQKDENVRAKENVHNGKESTTSCNQKLHPNPPFRVSGIHVTQNFHGSISDIHPFKTLSFFTY